MRIVVWNCAMKLRGAKLHALEALNPDLAIVPECECPDRLWGQQPLLAPIPMEWIGDKPHKGLGVLAFNGYRVRRHADYHPSLRWMLPIEIRGPMTFHLLAVWAMNHRVPQAKELGLSGRSLDAARRYQAFLSAQPSIVAGDFNNNVLWDKSQKATNHACTVAALEQLGLASAYHVGRGELHGRETLATLYWRDRKPDGPKYHIDYCFLPLDWCSDLREVQVGPFDDWVGRGLSDHVPLIVDVNLPGKAAHPSPSPGRTARTDLDVK